jgi:hypothetical protein
MKNTSLAALGLVSMLEFLSAYPFNVETVGNEETGESLLVSNLDTSFQLDFSPLRMDGEEIAVDSLLNKLGDDESIREDWKMHVEREEFIARQVGNPTEMSDEEWEEFVSKTPRREMAA